MNIFIRAIIYLMVGATGEVLYTAFKALIFKHNLRLQGYTQLWVLPLYALGGVFIFEPLYLAIAGWNILLRFTVYALVIFALEFIFGFIDKRLIGRCPWQYKGKWNIGGYINLPHFPFWGAAGLLFEIIHNYLLSF